jgi:hypothetical protein
VSVLWGDGPTAVNEYVAQTHSGRVWHRIRRFGEGATTIVTDCGIEMVRGAFWRTTDLTQGATCRKCKAVTP